MQETRSDPKRGYSFERLQRLLGTTATARTAIVILTSAGSGAVHCTGQGLPGVQQATIVGLVLGGIRADGLRAGADGRTRRLRS